MILSDGSLLSLLDFYNKFLPGSQMRDRLWHRRFFRFPVRHRTFSLRLPRPAAHKRRSLPSGRLGAYLTTSRREVSPEGRSAEATRAKPSPSRRRSEAERRSLPSGRLGATLSLLEEKCLPKGDRLKPPGRSRVLRFEEAKKKRRSLPSGRLGAYLSLLEENIERGEELPPFLPFARPAQDALAPAAAASGA